MDTFVGEFRAAPHADVGGEEAAAFAIVVGGDLREVDPWDGGAGMVVAVPVVVEPKGIEPFPGAEVSGAFEDIALGAEVMDVLEGGPEDAEAAEEGEVFPGRDIPEKHP